MPAPKRYPDEIRDRAVRMVFEICQATGQRRGAVARVAPADQRQPWIAA